jgi:hypothetical protein
MRVLILASVLALAGCATEPVVAPREYLDEKTAATITVVADPWVFNREGTTPQLDFINLYAIDVNRMGDHRKYLVVAQYWPAPEWKAASPSLEIETANGVLAFQPTQADPRELGIGQAVDPAAPRSAKFLFYPIENANLEALARSRQFSVALVNDRSRAAYIVWRDGSAELSEFAAIALD